MISGFFQVYPPCVAVGDFGRGVLWTLGVTAGAIAAVAAVLFVLYKVFWSHRCSSITVKSPDGDIIISHQALAEAAERELSIFPELKLIRIRIYKYDQEYRITLNCEFLGEAGFPALANKVRPRLRSSLQEIFGVDKLSTINIVVEHFSSTASE